MRTSWHLPDFLGNWEMFLCKDKGSSYPIFIPTRDFEVWFLRYCHLKYHLLIPRCDDLQLVYLQISIYKVVIRLTPRVLIPCVHILRGNTPRIRIPLLLIPRVLIPGMLCPLPYVCCENKLSNIALRHNSSYDLARLHLVVPMDFWRNSTPFFGVAAFCTTKNGDFRRWPQK